MTKRDWVKVHLVCGVKTNIVTAVEITDRFAADINYFKPLVDATAANFTIQEVGADKAYLSAANLQTVVDHGAMPYIPFKVTVGQTGELDQEGGPTKRSSGGVRAPLGADSFTTIALIRNGFSSSTTNGATSNLRSV